EMTLLLSRQLRGNQRRAPERRSYWCRGGCLMTSAPLALSHAEELHTLVANADFRDVDIRPATKMRQYPSPHDFVLRDVAGSALGGFFATANETAQSALLDDVSLALSKYVDDKRVSVPD